jgi:hypothetical protein
MSVLAVLVAVALGLVLGVVAVALDDRPWLVQALFAVPVGVVGWQIAARIEDGFELGLIALGAMGVVVLADKARRRTARVRQASVD